MDRTQWTEDVSDGLGTGRQLRCPQCNSARLLVRQLPPDRAGGSHKNRVIAMCRPCFKRAGTNRTEQGKATYRIKLGTLMTQE